jgi:hypothetical protein
MLLNFSSVVSLQHEVENPAQTTAYRRKGGAGFAMLSLVMRCIQLVVYVLPNGCRPSTRACSIAQQQQQQHREVLQ